MDFVFSYCSENMHHFQYALSKHSKTICGKQGCHGFHVFLLAGDAIERIRCQLTKLQLGIAIVLGGR